VSNGRKIDWYSTWFDCGVFLGFGKYSDSEKQ